MIVVTIMTTHKIDVAINGPIGMIFIMTLKKLSFSTTIKLDSKTAKENRK